MFFRSPLYLESADSVNDYREPRANGQTLKQGDYGSKFFSQLLSDYTNGVQCESEQVESPDIPYASGTTKKAKRHTYRVRFDGPN
jgi:hypothetical protein